MTINEYFKNKEKDLYEELISGTLSLAESQFRINKMAKQLNILSQHKYSISQTGSSNRWRTRLPNGHQVYKKSYDEMILYLIEYYNSTGICTLTTLYNEWFELQKSILSSRTLVKKDKIWQQYFAKSSLATKELSSITTEDIKSFCCKVIKDYNLKQKYFNGNVKPILNKLFDYALEKELIQTNKARHVKIDSRIFAPKKVLSSTENVFTDEDIDKIMLKAYEENTPASLGIVFLFLTGLRIGELCPLKFSDIQGNILSINKELVVNIVDNKAKGYIIEDHTKTPAGIRQIILPNEAISLISRIKDLYKDLGYSTNPNDFIFQRCNCYTNYIPDYCNSRTFDATLRRYCKQLDIPYIKSPHDVRRTYVSILFESGMNPDTIRRLSGHENIEMTYKYCISRSTTDTLSTQINDIFAHKCTQKKKS